MMAKRYSLDGLIRVLGAEGMSVGQLADRLGLHAKTVYRARAEGLTEKTADLFACRAGFMPWVPWPEWLEDSIESVSAVCADERCGARFVPSRRGHRFCSDGCRKRTADRAYKARRREDPEFRARERKRLEGYRTERQREIGRRQRRAYYWANRDRELARQREYDATVRAQRRREAAA